MCVQGRGIQEECPHKAQLEHSIPLRLAYPARITPRTLDLKHVFESHADALASLTAFNRNFKARNDGNLRTMNFLASPEIVTAMAFSGSLTFNPAVDSIDTPNGPFRFTPPSGDRLPPTGYTPGDLSYAPSPSPEPQPDTEIAIAPTSGRLEILEPFGSNVKDGQGELGEMTCLMRVRGKCTTDHISAAGPWLKVCLLGTYPSLVRAARCGECERRKNRKAIILISSTRAIYRISLKTP